MREQSLTADAAAVRRAERRRRDTAAKRSRVADAQRELERATARWRNADNKVMALQADGASARVIAAAKVRAVQRAREIQAARSTLADARASKGART